MNLQRCIGFNYNLPNSVFDLRKENSKEIFFVSGNVGIVYDYELKTQKLLQGHTNQITAVAYHLEKGFLVTADSGLDSMIIIWSL
jgi:hypothetical protein